MRKYEIMIAVRGSLVDSEQKLALERLTSRLKKDKAEISFEESWGKIKMGYKISHETESYYHVLQFTMDSSKVKDLELFLELDQDIIRSLISKVEKDETPFTKEMYDAGMEKYLASRRERQTKAMPKTRATTAVQLQEEMQKIGDKQDNKMKSIIKDLSL